MNIITVQLQDYFQHKVFETVVDKRQWSRFESRIRRNVDETLLLLDKYDVKATFFSLGWIVERFPEILEEIEKEGHEIACAGFWGADYTAVTQSKFREDIRHGKEALERLTGHKIDGYRSIRRSFSHNDLWMIDLVAEEGFTYDSSVMNKGYCRCKVVNTMYPFVRQARRVSIHEFPHSSAELFGINIPMGGGNFLRQLPTSFTFGAFMQWIRRTDQPFMLYFHPWELDHNIPEVSAFNTLSRIRQYRNLGRLKELLPLYFEAAPFGSVREFLHLKCRNVPFTERRNECRTQESTVITHEREDPLPVSVVIPCFNEEATVGFLAKALKEVIAAAFPAYRLHFIFVDDKSSDDTGKLLHETFTDLSWYTILSLPENRGVSGAIHAGIDAAETEIVCSMDADCSYDPLELLKMIPMLDEKTSLITASPYHRDGGVLGVPGWRLFLSRGLSGIYRLFLSHKLATYTSCFRVYRRSVVQKYKPHNGDFRGIVELIARLDMAGEAIKEYPTILQSRIFGFSKMKTMKTIRDHIRLLFKMRKYKKNAKLTRDSKKNEDAGI